MTKIIEVDKIDEAALCLANGGTVAFPTETVYGLGCDAMNPIAIDKVYKAKGRPSDNPLIVHISKADDVYFLANVVSNKAKLIMERFWPGPLSIIFPKKSSIPLRVTGGLNTVAVRCPSDPIAREFIDKSGKFIAAPSANISGRPSPTTAKHVIDDLNGRIDYILCGEDSLIGIESTVIDVTGENVLILRPGAITKEMLAECINEEVVDTSTVRDVQAPKCPGMKYKHYAPCTELEVVVGEKDRVYEYISSKLKTHDNAGVLTFFKNDYDDARCVINAGADMQEYASGLFYNFRVFDEYKVSKVFVEFSEIPGIGVAVKNRLYKAAGNNIIRV